MQFKIFLIAFCIIITDYSTSYLLPILFNRCNRNHHDSFATRTTISNENLKFFHDQEYRRPLHWVLKTGNLEKSIDFFANNFKFQVFRHEEFDTGDEMLFF
jgi:hypothetical protein